MKTNAVALTLVIAVFVLSGYGQTGSPFTSKEGRFTAVAPAGFDKFEFKKNDDATASDGVTINQYSMDLGRGTCMMAYFDVPDSVFQSKSVQKILEDGRDGAVNKAKAVLDDQENITLDGYPGLSMNAHITSDKFVIYARVIFVLAKPR